MTVKIIARELLVAMPVLDAISKVRLPAYGAMKIAEIVKTAAEEANAIYEARNTKLAELTVKGDDGQIKFEQRTKEDGSTERTPVFLGEAEREQFDAFWYMLQEREVTLPYTLKPKFFEPTPNRAGSGYELSALDVIRLGKILSKVGLPPEPPEPDEETE